MTVIMCLIAGLNEQNDNNDFKMIDEVKDLISLVNKCLKIQVRNIKKQLLDCDS